MAGSLDRYRCSGRVEAPDGFTFAFAVLLLGLRFPQPERTPDALLPSLPSLPSLSGLVAASGSGSDNREDEFNRVKWPTILHTGAKATRCGAAYISAPFPFGTLDMQRQQAELATLTEGLTPRQAPETRPAGVEQPKRRTLLYRTCRSVSFYASSATSGELNWNRLKATRLRLPMPTIASVRVRAPQLRNGGRGATSPTPALRHTCAVAAVAGHSCAESRSRLNAHVLACLSPCQRCDCTAAQQHSYLPSLRAPPGDLSLHAKALKVATRKSYSADHRRVGLSSVVFLIAEPSVVGEGKRGAGGWPEHERPFLFTQDNFGPRLPPPHLNLAGKEMRGMSDFRATHAEAKRASSPSQSLPGAHQLAHASVICSRCAERRSIWSHAQNVAR